MKTSKGNYREKLHSSHWFVPALMTLKAIGASWVIIKIDRREALAEMRAKLWQSRDRDRMTGSSRRDSRGFAPPAERVPDKRQPAQAN